MSTVAKNHVKSVNNIQNLLQVPNVISHTTFWQRYFFRLFLLDREEKKRNDILARANTSASKDDDSNDGWGDDDEDDGEEFFSFRRLPFTANGNELFLSCSI